MKFNFFFFQLQVECEEVGTLSKLRVGHDNKGMGAAWFLDKVRGFQIKSPNQMKRLVAIGLFQKKNCTPPLISILLKLTSWISSQIYRDLPLKFSIFFALTFPPLEIYVFSWTFCIPPWNSSDFYSTPWNFPLISSTGGGVQFLFGKVHYLSQIARLSQHPCISYKR